ncbi:hypothetical protein [Amphritea balenae]|uniref:Uncharacterized protein n=1 Tax=Amphritea balenae TaxID=452629 RepID=A0A3P1SMN1_9GAMM|nr:hypothetical protein [Amphritea balenae]RRC98377.1 hypothetical protein EHS89_14925 [Amphritea balenae]GGK81413.1 hypothetical protein GCM10007941_34790 [Amphritea balenae]
MESYQWFILGVILMAILGYWNYQRTEGQLQSLQSAGFVVSDRLKGNPGVVISRSQRQCAVLIPTGYQRFDFSQIHGAEVRFDWASDTKTNFRLVLLLENAYKSEVEIGYQNEPQANNALKKLRSLVVQ